jgi:hypothetical protein
MTYIEVKMTYIEAVAYIEGQITQLHNNIFYQEPNIGRCSQGGKLGCPPFYRTL